VTQFEISLASPFSAVNGNHEMNGLVITWLKPGANEMRFASHSITYYDFGFG